MASTALQQLRAERRAQRENAGYQFDAPAAAPTASVSENEATRQLSQSSFGNRVSEDVAGIAYGVPAALATFATQSPLQTAKDIGGGLLQTGKDVLGVTGVLGRKQQAESLTYYKAHPVLAALDVASIFTFGAGTVLKTALTSTARTATGVAVRTAAKEGIEASIVNNILQTSRAIYNPNRLIRGSVKPNTTFMREIERVVRTGDATGVAETVRALLVKGGVDAEKAARISGDVGKSVSDDIIRQGTRVKLMDGLTHPIGATFRGTKSVAGAIGAGIFGRVSDSAVGKFFDQPILEANKKTSTTLENWLGAVVDERGWEQTTDNRFRVLREIKEQGDFQGLTQEQFLKDFNNYVQADVSRAKLGLENDYVLVKNLPENTATAMADTLKEAAERIKGEIGEAVGDPVTRTVQVFDKISEFMEENFGNAWTKYSETLRKSYGRRGNLNALEQAVRNLSKQKPTLTMKKLNDAQRGLVNDIESFGYQVGYAPQGKKISQAADALEGETVETSPRLIGDKGVAIGNQTTGGFTWESIQSTRNMVGKVLDDFGFSLRGTIEGSTEFLFSRSMTQHLMTGFREKFGNTIIINKPVVRTGEGITGGTTRVRIPVERLYEWLRNHRNELYQNRQGFGATRPFRPISVFDINKKDLVGIGFADDVADGIVSSARSSLREIPTSVTGVGEKLVNVLRGADGNFATFGKFYDTFLKTALYMRYQSSLSVFFQAQQFLETKIMGSMITKDARLFPGVQSAAGLGLRWTPQKIGGLFKPVRNLLQKVTIEPDLADLTIARDVILPNTRRSLQETIGGGEFGAIRKGVEMSEDGVSKLVARKTETGAQVLSSARVDAFWLQMWGGYAMKESARIGEAISNKFGLTLKDATAFTLENGQRVYQYPRVVREMQDAVQATLHYAPGFQTSPLVKTMNIVLFPFRFQAKSLEVAGKWLGSLEPMQRLVVINQLTHFSNWSQTEEGKDWIKTKSNLFYAATAYTTAWEQIGDSVDAVTRGELFGGNAGLIGGVPFSFVFNFMQQMGIIPEDEFQIDPRTGRPFRRKEVPRRFISDATALVALEEFLFTMVPGMPLYTITGGHIRGVGYRQALDEALEQGWAWGKAKLEGAPTDRGEALLDREFRNIPLGETRF